MSPKTQVERKNGPLGRLTIACRFICSFLVAAPLLYVNFVANGDAYHFLALVLLGPIAGIVLVGNSLFCFIYYRNVESYWTGLVFILVGVVGVLVAWHYLSQFRM